MNDRRLSQRCNHCNAPIHAFFDAMTDDPDTTLGVCTNGHDSVLPN